MTRASRFPPLSPISTGARGRCPRCGEGPLFSGYLATADSCSHCGLDFSFADSGDGPAVFIILLTGFVVVGLALWVEIAYQPAYWVHAVLWLPLILALTLGLLRPVKGILLCQQYVTRAAEHRTGDSRNR